MKKKEEGTSTVLSKTDLSQMVAQRADVPKEIVDKVIDTFLEHYLVKFKLK